MQSDLLVMSAFEFKKAVNEGTKIFTKIEFKEDIRQELIDNNIPFLFRITTKADPECFLTLPEKLVFTKCTFKFPFDYTFLNNITFIKCKFENFQMNNMNICNTNFVDCAIIDKVMKDSIFVKVSFTGTGHGCFLHRTDMSSSDFSDVTFGGAYLVETNFWDSSFEYCRLVNCDLDGANMSFTDFEDTFISRGTMSKVNLRHSNLDILPLSLNSRDIGGDQKLFDKTIATLSRFDHANLREDQIRLINTFWDMNLACGDHLKIDEWRYPSKPLTVSKQKLDFDKLNLEKFNVLNGELYLKGEPSKVENQLKSLKFLIEACKANMDDIDDKGVKQLDNLFELMQNLLKVLHDYFIVKSDNNMKDRFEKFISSLFGADTEDNLKVLTEFEFEPVNQIIRTKTSEIDIGDIAWALEEENIFSFMNGELTKDEEDALKRLITLLIINIPNFM